MYKELINKLAQGNEWVKIQPSCPEKKIVDAEKSVGYSFPKELRDLLHEMNDDKWLIMSAVITFVIAFTRMELLMKP